MQLDFYIQDPNLTYLDGNSLGRLPLAAAERVNKLLYEGWGTALIRGWNEDWIDLPMRLGAKLSQLIGAQPHEVVVADSTSVNLFKLATAALRLQSDRQGILTEATNFPSDLYILESAAHAAGHEQQVRVVGGADSVEFPESELLGALNEGTALVCLSHVAYRSGSLADMQRITKRAHECGALVLWDISHSVGCVPIDLTGCQADLAVGCTYKYLCGGPGAPAFLFVRQDLQDKLENPIQGWFSHAQPFEFDLTYRAASSIEKFLTGTPPILSLAAIEAGLDLVLASGIEQLRERSVQLTESFLRQFEKRLTKLGFVLRSPQRAERRGSHVSLGHPQAQRIAACLIERYKVIPDFRAPDNIRFGIAPLYTTEAELESAIRALERVVQHQEYSKVHVADQRVT